MSDSIDIIPDVDGTIRTVRKQRVILDTDLAALYGVQTFCFNEAVKRNRSRFPEDFMFQLTREEADALTSQIAMSKAGVWTFCGRPHGIYAAAISVAGVKCCVRGSNSVSLEPA